MAYQLCQFPALSPATSSTARRTGSKAKRMRISLLPDDPGLSSFR